MKMPRIPNGLLERCLETIPATTVMRQRAPRLNLEERSRKRLVWLSAAAAIPVVTVLAVLPVLKWSHCYHSKSEGQPRPFIDSVEKLDYVRVESIGSMSVRWKDSGPIIPDQRLLQIVDRNRGACYLVQRKSSRDSTAVDGRNSQMMLPNGNQYIVNHNTLGTLKWGDPARWNDIHGLQVANTDVWIGSVNGWVKSGWGSMLAVKPTRFLGTWKGKPALVEMYLYDLPNMPYRIRVERYSSVETGLAIAQKRFIDTHPKKVGHEKSVRQEPEGSWDMVYYQAEYFYQPNPGEEKYFNSTEFLKAAKQIYRR